MVILIICTITIALIILVFKFRSEKTGKDFLEVGYQILERDNELLVFISCVPLDK